MILSSKGILFLRLLISFLMDGDVVDIQRVIIKLPGFDFVQTRTKYIYLSPGLVDGCLVVGRLICGCCCWLTCQVKPTFQWIQTQHSSGPERRTDTDWLLAWLAGPARWAAATRCPELLVNTHNHLTPHTSHLTPHISQHKTIHG